MQNFSVRWERVEVRRRVRAMVEVLLGIAIGVEGWILPFGLQRAEVILVCLRMWSFGGEPARTSELGKFVLIKLVLGRFEWIW
jgi:hypothetical protein